MGITLGLHWDYIGIILGVYRDYVGLWVCAGVWGLLKVYAQRVLSTNIGKTYSNHKGSYYYRNHTLYHISTLDPLGLGLCRCLGFMKGLGF